MTGAKAAQPTTHNRDTYNYEQDALYQMNEQDHQNLKLYQERLVAKQQVKSEEVAIGKRVETETASVSVPVEKESGL